MVLPICAEFGVRLFFNILKFFLEHWVLIIVTTLIAFSIAKKPFLAGLLAFAVNFIDDTIVHWIPLKVALAIVLGFMWMVYILACPANILLKILAAPVFLLLGTIWGLIPVPIPLSFYTYVIRHRTYANLTCAAAAILVLAGIMGLGSWIGLANLCMYLNSFLQIMNEGFGHSLWQWFLSYF